MRLIDADELKKDAVEMETFLPYGGDGTVMAVDVDCIDVAPTIDAELVRHGRWRYLGGDEWCCTICGEVIYTEGSWEKPTHKYCHECGAKMDGKRK